MDLRASYTAASSLPLKLLQHTSSALSPSGRIRPVHVQLNLTNRCNLNCAFCSCASRDKTLEIPAHDVLRSVAIFQRLGALALTITGGGEPLLYPDVDMLLRVFSERGLALGLVTNGTQFHRITPHTLNRVTWCRISWGDDRDFSKDAQALLSQVIREAPAVDWAFSYVLGANPNWDTLPAVVAFANQHKLSHVRVVSDLLDTGNVPDPDTVRENVRRTVSDDRVIYQGRKTWEHGVRNCLISLLKPLFHVDGNIYPCCGVQYALEEESLDFPSSMSMGADIEEVWSGAQVPFDGSRCVRCYYGDYNRLLASLRTPLAHWEFV